MNDNEIKEFLEKIDIHYGTDYAKNKNLVIEWKKQLKKYASKDVFRKLEEHLRGDFSNIPPKLYFLIKDLKTPEEQIELDALSEQCKFCGEFVKLMEFDKHYERCMDIDFIERNVKKYLNTQIIRSDYYEMSDEDIKKRFEKIAKVVMEKSENKYEINAIKMYFKTKGE